MSLAEGTFFTNVALAAVLLIYRWAAAVLAFGSVPLALFDRVRRRVGIGIGLLVSLLVSAIPRLREVCR